MNVRVSLEDLRRHAIESVPECVECEPFVGGPRCLNTGVRPNFTTPVSHRLPCRLHANSGSGRSEDFKNRIRGNARTDLHSPGDFRQRTTMVREQHGMPSREAL